MFRRSTYTIALGLYLTQIVHAGGATGRPDPYVYELHVGPGQACSTVNGAIEQILSLDPNESVLKCIWVHPGEYVENLHDPYQVNDAWYDQGSHNLPRKCDLRNADPGAGEVIIRYAGWLDPDPNCQSYHIRAPGINCNGDNILSGITIWNSVPPPAVSYARMGLKFNGSGTAENCTAITRHAPGIEGPAEGHGTLDVIGGQVDTYYGGCIVANSTFSITGCTLRTHFFPPMEWPAGIYASGSGYIGGVKVEADCTDAYGSFFIGPGFYGVDLQLDPDEHVTIVDTSIDLRVTTAYHEGTGETEPIHVCGILNGQHGPPFYRFPGSVSLEDCAVNLTGVEGQDASPVIVCGVCNNGFGTVTLLPDTSITTSWSHANMHGGGEYLADNVNGVLIVDWPMVEFGQSGQFTGAITELQKPSSVVDASGAMVAAFDGLGNLALAQTIASEQQIQQAPAGSFVVEAQTPNEIVAYIDPDGNIVIKGNWHELGTDWDPLADGFKVTDTTSNVVAYIDYGGNLRLKGRLYTKTGAWGPSPPVLSLLQEVLDTNLPVTTGGYADWCPEGTVHYCDVDAAQSGDIDNSQESWLEAGTSGPGTVSFYWKVSSEADHDYLKFCIDSVLEDQISGIVSWHARSYSVCGSGSHKLKWTYSKDGLLDCGRDAGWVDGVQWTPAPAPPVGNIDQRTLTASSSSGGSVTTPGIGSFQYDHGTVAPIVANPSTNYHFVNWTGTAVDAGKVTDPHSPATTVTVDGDCMLRANFATTLAILYVDDNAPADPCWYNPGVSDPCEDGSANHPLDEIGEAIGVAVDGVTIIVRPGTYYEIIDFAGKTIKITSFEPNLSLAVYDTVIDANGLGTVVTFDEGEDANSVLEGFVITRGKGTQAGGIHCHSSSPTIKNCLLVGNRISHIIGGAIYCHDSNCVITNCTIADNFCGEYGGGLLSVFSTHVAINNSIIWGNWPNQVHVAGDANPPTIAYSMIQSPGAGSASNDPLFTAPGFWADVNTPDVLVEPNDPNATWVAGDYHLKSQAGRWGPDTQTWVKDGVTSPCIDAGDPSSDWTAEPWPHGGRINIGAFGGTAEASMSFVPPQTMTLQQALDSTLTFNSGGNANWVVDPNESWYNNASARSGQIGDLEESWLQTMVQGEGTLRFRYRISCGSGDGLVFCIDGQSQFCHGILDGSWNEASYYVGGWGSHTLKWRYVKDSSGSGGSDCAWVDHVQWMPAGADSSLQWALDVGWPVVTGGDVGWFGQSMVYYYDGDAAESGDVDDSQGTWLRATASSSGTVQFYWKVSSEANWDYLSFYLDGEFMDHISGDVDWQQKSYSVTGSGTHTFQWMYIKDGSTDSGSDCGWVDDVRWEPGPPPPSPLQQALDTTLAVATGADSAGWFAQSSVDYDDGDAAQSGHVGDSQETWFQATANGPGTVQFYWKVSSEAMWDDLSFYLDGEFMDHISGDVDWQQKSYSVTGSGTHTFQWMYIKDGSVSAGSDCGWVDKLTFSP